MKSKSWETSINAEQIIFLLIKTVSKVKCHSWALPQYPGDNSEEQSPTGQEEPQGQEGQHKCKGVCTLEKSICKKFLHLKRDICTLYINCTIGTLNKYIKNVISDD